MIDVFLLHVLLAILPIPILYCFKYKVIAHCSGQRLIVAVRVPGTNLEVDIEHPTSEQLATLICALHTCVEIPLSVMLLLIRKSSLVCQIKSKKILRTYIATSRLVNCDTNKGANMGTSIGLFLDLFTHMFLIYLT